MSKKNQKPAGNGKTRPLIIILLVLMFIIIVLLAGFMYFEMNKIKNQVAGHVQQSTSAAAKTMVPPIYVPLDTFTVSLKPESDNSERVLYIGLTLRLANERDKTILTEYLPEIRSRLLMLLSQQTASDLSMEQGKAQLVKDIETMLKTPLPGKQSLVVTDVLFNAFILR
ncbi:Flagellar protein FliL [Enterobacter sp. DC4]|uniref:flagellar basal body-associated protein FliL n=1 Tax=Enterobacter sp. DC4 TaxID=1395580 RepID=UPI0003ED0B1E|nr:flagellar basal body-associated protein FliL [Enterobacter sp. DC4]EWG67267.1 Flagellar protein FliL [Enterobacter sp. DC4]